MTGDHNMQRGSPRGRTSRTRKAIIDPATQSARPRPEPTVRFALPGEGERLIFELRTAHGSVVRIVAPRREPPVPVDERRTGG